MAAIDSKLAHPRWMTTVLKLAGIYNLCWGTWVILFPLASLKVCGYPNTPVYPELWQCIGMIVGVYGIGYWIAAGDPFRHWPIVLVGFLGKVLGPIGFVYGWSLGRLPASAGVVNIFNDLIWLVPFAIILLEAFRFAQTGTASSQAYLSFSDLAKQHQDQSGRSLFEYSRQQPMLVVFLRHAGCTFCRETLAQLQQHRSEIEAAGVGIIVVHMDNEEMMAKLFARYQLSDLPRISDPKQELYVSAEIANGEWKQLFNWRVMTRGFKTALIERHGFWAASANPFRMPGAVLFKDGEIMKQYQPQDAADHPDYCEFVDISAMS